jgi:hypothetical protein
MGESNHEKKTVKSVSEQLIEGLTEIRKERMEHHRETMELYKCINDTMEKNRESLTAAKTELEKMILQESASKILKSCQSPIISPSIKEKITFSNN